MIKSHLMMWQEVHYGTHLIHKTTGRDGSHCVELKGLPLCGAEICPIREIPELKTKMSQKDKTAGVL